MRKKRVHEAEESAEAAVGENKKISRGTKILLIIACTIVGIAVLLLCTVLIMSKLGENALTDKGENVEISANADVLDNGEIRYKGQLYRYNEKITSVLLMGIDKREKTAPKSTYGNSSQSDANVLAVFDTENKKLTLLSISRDSMCKIDVLDENGNNIGTSEAQLALAYSYGEGGDVSCELTANAVSGIMRGIKIPAYGAIYMDGIIDLVDLVGGVDVTPYKSFGAFTEGKTVTLKGSLTEQYIRPRAHTTEGNNERMQRQSQVVLALAHKALNSAKHDPMSIPELYSGVKDNVTTNINPAMMVYLAKTAVTLDFDGQLHKIPGESVLGEDGYAEFNIDEEALFEMILDIYYVPVQE